MKIVNSLINFVVQPLQFVFTCHLSTSLGMLEDVRKKKTRHTLCMKF